MLQSYTSDTGETFSAGKVYRCTGPRANTQALKDAQSDSVIQAALDEKGFVKVDDHLRLHDAPHIFAVGDIVESRMFPSTGAHVVTGIVAAERTANFATVQGVVAVENIIRTVQGEEALMSIDPSRNVNGQSLAIDMGPEQGVAVIKYEVAEFYKTIGFDFGGDPEHLKQVGVSLSDKVPGVKQFISSVMAKSMMDADTHNMFWGMKTGYQEVIDPLAPAADAPAEEAPAAEEAKSE